MPKKSYKGHNFGARSKKQRGKRAQNKEVRSDDSPHTSGHFTYDQGSNYGSGRSSVSFNNPSRPGKKHEYNKLKLAIESQLDDDVAMSSELNDTDKGIMFRDRNRGSSTGVDQYIVAQRAKLLQRIQKLKQTILADCNNYKVNVVNGHLCEKEYIIKTLMKHMAPNTFIPIMYKIVGKDAIFYVDNKKAATDLVNCNRRTVTNNGHLIEIKVHSGYPNCEVTDALKARMKLAMAKRYVAETNSLDLSQFHHDPELVDDYFCALFRPNMLISVLNIVAEVIPNLHALNLSNNKLSIIEKLNVLSKKFTNLKILYIGDNNLKELNQLNALKDLNLEELQLKGNPFCSRYENRNDNYISDVRKRFPKLLRLDDVELPKPIVFDIVEEEVILPPTKIKFANDPTAEKIAVQFMQQYFTVFDSNSRQPLLDAYHANAYFSLTIAPSSQIQKFNKYLPDNRNLLRTNDTTRRKKLLKQGRLPIVSYISEMPKTQHYLNSFTMDINLVTEGMMLITVTGCFKELDTKDQPIRSFNRIFIIVPEGTGYCIKNEQLHLSHPTVDQEKQTLNSQSISSTSSSQPQPEQSNTTTNPILSDPSQTILQSSSANEGPSIEIQQQMTMMLSQQTNMNLEWSFKCLKEVQWNYDTALIAFNDFFKSGAIPPIAFQK
ncbi:hypothetical protein PV327_006445 [Microctonus hyperodae]|uniref:Nuclear RNA export factor 1 n=1 Tax=Microctonus hyperodae TaxID=165561 RepID=A0AA39F4A4_MICHY|nr:hypothetical protein PV327_006445 [Microctonus hyperodae]